MYLVKIIFVVKLLKIMKTLGFLLNLYKGFDSYNKADKNNNW